MTAQNSPKDQPQCHGPATLPKGQNSIRRTAWRKATAITHIRANQILIGPD